MNSVKENERYIGFYPAKSGYRNFDGTVIYNCLYYPEFLEGDDPEEYSKKFNELVDQIKPIFVPMTEVVSIREHSWELHQHFGHD